MGPRSATQVSGSHLESSKETSGRHARTVIPVSPSFRPYVDAAVLRLAYLLPDVVLEVGDDSIMATHSSEQDGVSVRRDVTHCLYREKIYQETLSMRRDLVAALTRRS